MAVHFEVPPSPARSILRMDNFLGADFTNSPAAVDITKSPNCKNIIRDVPGKIRKSMGYTKVFTDAGAGKFNGRFVLVTASGTIELFHIGKKLYKVELKETTDPSTQVVTYSYEVKSTLSSSLNDAISRAYQFGAVLYICDGQGIYTYDGTTFANVEDNSTIPVVTIAKAPSGGGTSYNAINLLNTGFTELFLSDGTSTAYHLSFGTLNSSKPPKVEVMNNSGVFIVKTLGTDYTVDYASGIINFVSAPPVSPITGEDNVRITAYRNDPTYGNRVKQTTVGIKFGTNGDVNRLFLGGNPEFRNYDWHSDVNDPTYFPDTSYSAVGSSESAIVGYCMINNNLATFKDSKESDQTVFLRQSTKVNDITSFATVGSLQGEAAIAKRSFSYLANEPLFLTKLGVYAITSTDVTGEKFGQCRSFYLNGKLLSETDLENAYAFTYKDFYFLIFEDRAYILDGLQALAPVGDIPYSTRQYAGFYRTNLPARVAWNDYGTLFFATKDGKVYRFFTDPDVPESYNDDGEPIEAIWETPDITGNLFYKNKTFRYLAVQMSRAFRTSMKVYSYKRGMWSLVKEDASSMRYLMFSALSFSLMTFSSDNSDKLITSKMRLKKVDKARFRFANDVKDESFGIFAIGIEYVENGNYKG